MTATALGSVTLVEGITQAQIDAATRIYERLPSWRASVDALIALRNKFPGLADRSGILLKVVAVNSLFGTNIYAVVPMSDHLHPLLRGIRAGQGRPELVEQMAALTLNGKVRHHRSFASKFAHFFVDETLPILDALANETLTRHLGLRSKAVTYIEFAMRHAHMKKLAGLSCSDAEFDRYLWLAGHCHHWREGNHSRMFVALRTLLEERKPRVESDIDILVGPVGRRTPVRR